MNTTIKRVILSMILLQTICQPISAIDLANIRTNAITLSQSFRNELSSGINEIKNTITSHPIISGTAFISFIGLCTLGNYIRYQFEQRFYANVAQRRGAALAQRAQAKADFVQFINNSANQGTIDLEKISNQSFYKYLNKDEAFTLSLLINTYNEKKANESLQAIIYFVESITLS